ncbi:MAG: hypothetical protein J7M38_08310 [Armatimonadetes bacterium]|nr:hypothetical protein [Armatimonadota bacterium]
MMRRLMTAYLWDEALLQAANLRGENYWFAWAQDLFEAIGAPAVALPPEALGHSSALKRLSTLALPDLPADYLTEDQRAALRRWVEAGGLLIGMGTEGLDDLFGVRAQGHIPQQQPWDITATLRLTGGELARPLYHPDRLDRDLLVASDVRLLLLDGARELASLGDAEGRALDCPAVTLRSLGKGWACLFAFDPAHTVWAVQQGRPIDRDWVPDGYLRSSDGMITGDRDASTPVTDLLVFLLRNVVALTGQPMIYPLPALDGAPADALLFWGGDDEAAAGTQLPAAQFMAERGLPYHINIMPRGGEFTVSPEEFARLRELGTEPSLHLNFIDDYEHPLHFTREDIAAQVRLYRDTYGETPVCTVFHWVLWCGWTEPAEWLREEEVLADNSRFGSNRQVINPTNECAYAYGTAFPFFFRLGPEKGNQRLDFISEPITAYECGYDRQEDRPALEPLHRALDNAAFWHTTCNLFYHPVNIHRVSSARDAVDEVLRYTAERGIRVVHMGNDEVNFWWRARTAARMEDVRADEEGVEFTAECDWPSGFVVSVPVSSEAVSARVDDEPAEAEVRHEHGRGWARIALSGGRHELAVTAAAP